MSNAGLIAGLKPTPWTDYVPRIVATGGTPVQHVVSDERNVKGRFLVGNQGLVKVFIGITLVAGDTLPSGETFGWYVSLPAVANRASGGADLPIGTAMLWQGAAADPSPLMIGQVLLADPAIPVTQGREDRFCMVAIAGTLGYGTATIPSGSTSVTVTHGLGGTPNAYDLRIVLTNTPTTNPQWWSVQNIGATTFDIVVKTNPSTTGATFAWKADCFPNGTLNQIMGSNRPWVWAAGHRINMQLEYEARR